MTFLKYSRRQYALACISVLLLIPVVLAVIAPLLAPIPSQAAGWTAPPLPDRDERLPDFQHLLDPLPLVVRDLPDAASQEAVAIYEATSFADNQSAQRMLLEAEEAVHVPTNLNVIWQSWLRNWRGDAAPNSVMASLQQDSRNADRLNNLAVAMFFGRIPQGQDVPSLSGDPTNQALSLLDSALEYFPGSRSLLLNFRFLWNFRWITGPIDSRSADFDAWLALNPNDTSALQLAVQIYVKSKPQFYDQDPVALQTLIVGLSKSADPAHSALGYALLGDLQIGNLQLYSGEAYSKMEEAPFEVMHSARLALESYDQALLRSDDPSIYSARALALSLLGDIPAAIASQQRAVAFNPGSISLRLLLADLYLQQRGDIAQMHLFIEKARSSEREALDIAATLEMPSLSEIRIHSGSDKLVGLASHRPERFYIDYPTPPMAGGGYLVAFDEIPLFRQSPASSIASNPVSQAIQGVILKSEALGDLDGLEEDFARRQVLIQDTNWELSGIPVSSDSSLFVARLVADPSDLPRNLSNFDPYLQLVFKASNWLEFVGANQKAVDLCQVALSLRGAEVGPEGMQRCIGENAYLAGDYKTSQEAFEALNDDFMVGYVAERRGDLDEARQHYRMVTESNDINRNNAILRLADVLLEIGEPEDAINFYNEFIAMTLDSANEMVCYGGMCMAVANVLPFAISNRGVARLHKLARDNGRIDCKNAGRDACNAALRDFDTALEYDSYNPVFLMNKAWVMRLLGDQDVSTQLMSQAREADPSLFPVLNDLGVFAATFGDSRAARQYFLDAAAANPQYDLALWNLGVLHMQQGIDGIFRGQAYLARAILQNPSLVTDSITFHTDERIYRVEITERLRPGAGWSFGAASSVAIATFGFITLVLMIGQATYLVAREKLLDILHSNLETRLTGIRQRVSLKPPFAIDDRWTRWLAMAITLTVLTLTTTWVARASDPNVASASVALALFATVLAVVTHELGHALVARRLHVIVRPAQWAPGTAIALVLALLPGNLASGPFPGQKVFEKNDEAAKWVYLAGPLANLCVAILAYRLFQLQPLPGLRLISQVQLAAMGYALLPFAPLDGAELARSHPRWLGLWGGAAVLTGVLFSLGIL